MKEFLKSHIKPFLQSVAFFLIFILIFLSVQKIFVLKGSGYSKYMYYNEEENDSLNLLFFGNSRCNRAIDPVLIDEKVGSYSYNMGIQGLRANHVYYRIADALKTQSPDVVAVEISICVPASNDTIEESYMHRALGSLPTSFFKLNAAMELGNDKDQKVELFLPLLRFHARYEELDVEDFAYSMTPNSDFENGEAKNDKWISSHRGYTPYPVQKDLEPKKKNYFKQDYSGITDIAVLDETSAEYIPRIVEAVKAKGCKLLFFSIPATSDGKNGKTTIPVMNYLRATYGDDEDIAFLDLHDHLEEVGLDYQFYQNTEHTNAKGAKLVSTFMADYISANYPELKRQ